MLNRQEHIIKKQTIAIRLRDSKKSWAIQDEVSALYNEKLIDILADVCEEFGLEDNQVRIPEMELDLGAIQEKDIHHDFLTRTEELFRKALTDMIRSKKQSIETPKQKYDTEKLIYFLKYGVLPWWASSDEDLQLLFKKIIQDEGSPVKNYFLPTLKFAEARQRLIHQFDRSDVLHFIEKVTTDAAKFLSTHQKYLIEFLSIRGAIQQQTTKINTLILDAVLKVVSSPDRYQGKDEKDWLNNILIYILRLGDPSENFLHLWSQFSKSRLSEISKSKAQQEIISTMFMKAGLKISDSQLGAMIHLNKVLGTALTELFQKLEVSPDHDLRYKKKDGLSKPENSSKPEADPVGKDPLHDHSEENIDDDPEVGSSLNKDLMDGKQKSAIPLQSLKSTFDQLSKEQEDSMLENEENSSEVNQDSTFNDKSVVEDSESYTPSSTEGTTEDANNSEELSQENGSIVNPSDNKIDESKHINSSDDGELNKSKVEPAELRKNEEGGANEEAKRDTQVTEDDIEQSFEELASNKFSIPGLFGQQETNQTNENDEPLGLDWPDDPIDEIDEVYIDNSGLVILWPYFSHFFDHLKLTSEGDFISDKTRNRSLFILQHLVDPYERAYEQKLFLNKLLTEWPLNKHTGKPLKVSKRMDTEAEEFLEAVITNWSILKNTSTGAFRSTFLHRDGLLKKKGMDWVLQVDQKPYDVVFEHLPWPISIVKLPWMNRTIYVEW